MYAIPTYKMVHPEHGECIADATAEPQLRELGWLREGEGVAVEVEVPDSASTETVAPEPVAPESTAPTGKKK